MSALVNVCKGSLASSCAGFKVLARLKSSVVLGFKVSVVTALQYIRVGLLDVYVYFRDAGRTKLDTLHISTATLIWVIWRAIKTWSLTISSANSAAVPALCWLHVFKWLSKHNLTCGNYIFTTRIVLLLLHCYRSEWHLGEWIHLCPGRSPITRPLLHDNSLPTATLMQCWQCPFL